MQKDICMMMSFDWNYNVWLRISTVKRNEMLNSLSDLRVSVNEKGNHNCVIVAVKWCYYEKLATKWGKIERFKNVLIQWSYKHQAHYQVVKCWVHFFFFNLEFQAWCSLIVNYFIDLTNMQFIRAHQQQHKSICNFNKIELLIQQSVCSS